MALITTEGHCGKSYKDSDEPGDAAMHPDLRRVRGHLPEDGGVLPTEGRETRRGGVYPAAARLRRGVRAVRPELQPVQWRYADGVLRGPLSPLRRLVPPHGRLRARRAQMLAAAVEYWQASCHASGHPGLPAGLGYSRHLPPLRRAHPPLTRSDFRWPPPLAWPGRRWRQSVVHASARRSARQSPHGRTAGAESRGQMGPPTPWWRWGTTMPGCGYRPSARTPTRRRQRWRAKTAS